MHSKHKKLEHKIDYYQDEWCSGNSSPLNSSLNQLLPPQKNIPMPTLYTTAEGHRKSVKPTITQLLFYNMTSVLASVGE